jgi:integrase
VVRLSKGRYRVFVDLGRDKEGRRQRHTEVVRGTKVEAEQRERELRRALDTGTFVDPRSGTVAAFLERWLVSVEAKVQERTFLRYEQIVRTHLIPDLGSVRLAALRPLHVEAAERDWLRAGNRRTGGPLAPQTVLHIHRCLHTALERAVKWRLVAVNPVDGVDAPHVPEQEMAFLTPEESARLVEVLGGHEYELPILVGLYCGLRPTEYLALRWRDLDLGRAELRVMQNVHEVRKDRVTEHMGERVRGFRFAQTKTHRSKRPVSVPREVVECLGAWQASQAGKRAAFAEAWVNLDLVFTDDVGLPLSEERVRKSFYGALQEAGVRRVRLYDLRHTMATLVLHDTKDIKLVAARLGHANEYLVLRRYGHLLPGVDRDATDRLSEMIRQARLDRRGLEDRQEEA